MKVPWYAKLLYWVIDRLNDLLLKARNKMAWHVRKRQVASLNWTCVYWADMPGWRGKLQWGRFKWKDLSGNRHHMRQPDPSKRPTFHSGASDHFNEHGSFQFTGVISGPITEEEKAVTTKYLSDYFGIKYREEL